MFVFDVLILIVSAKHQLSLQDKVVKSKLIKFRIVKIICYRCYKEPSQWDGLYIETVFLAPITYAKICL